MLFIVSGGYLLFSVRRRPRMFNHTVAFRDNLPTFCASSLNLLPAISHWPASWKCRANTNEFLANEINNYTRVEKHQPDMHVFWLKRFDLLTNTAHSCDSMGCNKLTCVDVTKLNTSATLKLGAFSISRRPYWTRGTEQINSQSCLRRQLNPDNTDNQLLVVK